MHTRQSLSRTLRNLTLTLHLTVDTVLSVIASTRFDWRQAPASHRLQNVCRKLPRTLSYYVSWAVDPRDFFAVDGDHCGRRRIRLNPAAQKQRRNLSDLRRRRIGVLLRALGDTPQQVQASLTRHWLIDGADHPFELIEDYLSARLRHRDPHALNNRGIFYWVCNFGGTWVALPAPVRRYMADAGAHLNMLEDNSHLPRRGPRILTSAASTQPMVSIRTCRCCKPVAR